MTMDYEESDQTYTRKAGDGFQATLRNGLIEVRQETLSEVMMIALIPDEARDLVQALEGFLKIVKDEA